MPGQLTVGERGVFVACFLFRDLMMGTREAQLLTIGLRASAVDQMPSLRTSTRSLLELTPVTGGKEVAYCCPVLQASFPPWPPARWRGGRL